MMFYRKINAPTMAYLTVYGHMPDPPIYGHEATHKTYNLNGIPIDEKIPKRAMSMIMKMEDIETRASCQGQSERLVTFLIFRPLYQDERYVQELVSNLRKENVKSSYDRGLQGKFRICIADRIWYSTKTEKEFKQWWNNLPHVISNALLKTNEKFNISTDDLYLYALVERSLLPLVKKYGILSVKATYDIDNTRLLTDLKLSLAKLSPDLKNASQETVLNVFTKLKEHLGIGPNTVILYLRNMKYYADNPKDKQKLRNFEAIRIFYKDIKKYKPVISFKGKVKEVTWTELKQIAATDNIDALFEDLNVKDYVTLDDYPMVCVDCYKISPDKLIFRK